jgi:hypothetical protein
MFEPRIILSRSLFSRLRKVAESKGYSSTDEFAVHVLEKAAESVEEELSEEEVRRQLKGLGYLG